MLLEELTEMRTNRLAVAKMLDLQRSLTPKAPFMPHQTFLHGNRFAQRLLSSEIENRRRPGFLLRTFQTKLAGGLLEPGGRGRVPVNFTFAH